MHSHRLVRFIKNGEVERFACLSRCRSKPIAALVGRKYDLWSIGVSAKQGRDLDRVCVGGQSEVIDFTNKFIALKITDRLVTANAKPIWLNAVGKKFTGPIG